MAFNIEKLIADAKAIRAEIQLAIEAGEHILETVKGDVPTGQLVVAAGAAGTLVTNLENHIVAAQQVTEAAKAEVAAASETK